MVLLIMSTTIEQLGGINNTVYLYGIPFGINGIDVLANEVRQLFVNTAMLEC